MGDEDPISEKEQVIEQQGYHFDDFIIEDILTRLPIKSILRFKSVSKKWYSTLSSSDFVISHFMKSPFSHPSAPINTLLIQSYSNCYLFSYNDDQFCGNFEDNLVKLDPSEFWLQKGKFQGLQLTGCCNGLICLTPLSGEYFILWNPATRKMRKYETHWKIELSPFVSGFGYASSVDDYKYLQLSMTGIGFEKCHNIVHIFFLRENKWRTLDFDHTAFIEFNPPVLVNELLHWPSLCHQTGHSMLSFDLGVERFDRVNLDSMECLGVMGGCLSKCNSSGANTGEMLMHIFESESPGVIVKSIVLPESLRLGWASQMIGFTTTGKFFVTGPLADDMWHTESQSLGIVDTATKPLQYTTVLTFDEMIHIARYVPSLVSPFPVEELSRA